MDSRLFDLVTQALAEPEALPVLGDYVLESGWFDARVLQVMWPITKYPRNGYRTKKIRDRAKVDREAHKAGYPMMFHGIAAKPTTAWARGILAVLLFGTWKQRPWPLTKRMPQHYRSAWVSINGVRLMGSSVSWEPSPPSRGTET